MKIDAVVIGAGPAGLAFACRFAEKDKSVVLMEASPFVGGLARSISLWNSTVDLGPHRFFSSDPVVNKYWHSHIREDFEFINRITRIYYKGKFYNYPLRAWNAFSNLGIIDSVVAFFSFLKVSIFKLKQDGSLETWVSSRFGKKLFEIFFKTYTEKVWGIDCKNIDADWASQRIQGLTLWKAIKGALMSNKGNKIKTLVDEFAYPKGGNSLFYERQTEFLAKKNAQIRLKDPVRRVVIENMKVIGVENNKGEFVETNLVISSMPLTILVQGLPNVPFRVLESTKKLRFRNTILVYLLINASNLFPDQWLYIHDKTLKHGRITNFNNWSNSMIGDTSKTILCMEFWCYDEDVIWESSDKVLIELAISEIKKTGLINENEILDGHVIKLSKSYPVYEKGYSQHLQTITDYLDQIEGLFPIGRYGSFKYNNQDHSILMGIVAADEILQSKKPQLWAINTETTYQEAANSKVLKEDS